MVPDVLQGPANAWIADMQHVYEATEEPGGKLIRTLKILYIPGA